MDKDKKIPRAAIVLSGCGVFDGSEIHEAVIALLCLQRGGARTEFFAPDVPQADCVNHLTGEPRKERRGVLEESARIARGAVSPLSEFDAEKFDILVFAGGFGAAKTLSTFARDGAECSVEPSVERAILSMRSLGKKSAFLYISPVIAAKVLGGGVRLTIGDDPATAAAISAMGATHIKCAVDSFVEDSAQNVYSTPAYMLARNAAEVEAGMSAMVSKMLKTL